MSLTAAIYGFESTALTDAEKRFFAEQKPFGYILFARNCESPEQLKRLVTSLHEIDGRTTIPILIDQEGGRVARLKPPHWPAYPPAKTFADVACHDMEKAKQAVYMNARLIASDLASMGITVNCAPLADLPVKGAHDIIGDRAFGTECEQVVSLARAQAEGLMDGGVVPVLKHIPGHGRAFADSHEELPVVREPLDVLRKTDFEPFRQLADLPMGMTAHVLYTAIDDKHLATVSPAAIRLIREDIGFDGLLMSDDLSMKAMEGDFTKRAQDVLSAGCDVVLHCNGKMKEMQAVAKGVRPLSGKALERSEKAMRVAGKAKQFDVATARAELKTILAA